MRGNQAPFITKSLSKAIMRRSKLKNRYITWPTEENQRMYKNQRNYCSNLLTKTKKTFFNNLDLKIFEDNKTFWQKVKPLFSDKKTTVQSNIVIIEDGIVYIEINEVAEKLNFYVSGYFIKNTQTSIKHHKFYRSLNLTLQTYIYIPYLVVTIVTNN